MNDAPTASTDAQTARAGSPGPVTELPCFEPTAASLAAAVAGVRSILDGARFPLEGRAYGAAAVDILLDRLVSAVGELEALVPALAEQMSSAANRNRGPQREVRTQVDPLLSYGQAPLRSHDRAVVTVEAIRAIVTVVREARAAGPVSASVAPVDTTGYGLAPGSATPTIQGPSRISHPHQLPNRTQL